MKTILFDLDDTLLDFQMAERTAISTTLRKMDIEPSEAIVAAYSRINAGQWLLLEKGETTREQLLTDRFRLLYEWLHVERSAEQTKALYEQQLSQQAMLIPGSLELLETLSTQYDLYIVSNGTAVVQDSRLALSGLSRFFRNIFISQRIGVDKPNKTFFDRCFASIPNFRQEETIIVGDSLTSDIFGGWQAGIHTCWYNPKGKPRRDEIPIEYEIAELGQLPALLKRIG